MSASVSKKRQRLLKNLEEQAASSKAGRIDARLANVIISERRIKTSAKFKISDIPHPFTTVEEYERSLQMPLGGNIIIFVIVVILNSFNRGMECITYRSQEYKARNNAACRSCY